MTPSDYKVTVWWTVLMVGLACATGFGVGVLTANVVWAFLSAVCSVVLLEAVTTITERVTLWQLRHPRKAWWMAHTGKRLVAEYEQEYQEAMAAIRKPSLTPLVESLAVPGTRISVDGWVASTESPAPTAGPHASGTFRVDDWVYLNPAVAPHPIQQLFGPYPGPRRVVHVEGDWVEVAISADAGTLMRLEVAWIMHDPAPYRSEFRRARSP